MTIEQSLARIRGACTEALRAVVHRLGIGPGPGFSADDDERAGRVIVARGEALLALAPGGSTGHRALRDAARSLRLPDVALARVLGHGAAQAEALAARCGVTDDRTGEVIRIGALFNLGIALFDRLCDGYPERASLLWSRVTPTSLASPRALGGGTSDPAVDALLLLIAEVLGGARRLGGDPDSTRRFDATITTMYRAQKTSLAARREHAPTSATLHALGRKSVLPLWTMAVLASMATASPAPALEAIREDAHRAGLALWIVDDLVDVREDWLAEVWTRPWWALARRHPGGDVHHALPGDLDAALAALLTEGVVSREAARLAAHLAAIRDPALRQVIALAVRSWLSVLPATG